MRPKSRSLVRLLAVPALAASLICHPLPAAEVIWSHGPTTVNSLHDIDLVGSLVHAGSWGSSGTVTLSGESINFAGRPINSPGDPFASATANGTTFQTGAFSPPGGFDPVFTDILRGFAFDGPNPKQLTVSGLDVGGIYRLQIFTADQRGGISGRTQLWSDNPTLGAGNETAVFTHGSRPYVTATFVADSTSQILYGHGVGQAQNVVNAYVLRQIEGLVWDADPGTPGLQDGGGVWDTGITNTWSDGAANTTWTAGQTAVFGVGTGAPGPVTVNGTVVVGGLEFAKGYTLGGGTIDLDGNARVVVNNGQATTINSMISGDAMTVAGAGSLILTGANTYSGGTTLEAGRFFVTGSGTVGTGPVTVNSGAQFWSNASTVFNNDFTIAGDGNVGPDTAPRGALRLENNVLIGAGGSVTLSGPASIGSYGNNTGRIDAVISGNFPLTINAATSAAPGQIILAGANTYSGGTTLGAGRLLVTGGGTVGSGPVTVNSGAQFWSNASTVFNNDFTIAGDGNVGPDTAPRGALRLENNVLIGAGGSVTLSGPASIGSYSNNTGRIDANISGAFPLTINAAGTASPGTIVFGGTNTYSGGTTVAHGTLRITQPAALPGTGTHTVNPGATLQLDSAGNNTYSQSLAGAGRVLLSLSGGTTNTFLNGNNSGFNGLLELTGSGGNKLNAAGLNLNPDATIRINQGAQIFLNGATVANNIQISGTGNSENRGAIRATNGTITGNISLFGNANIGPEGNGTITGNITSGAAGTQTLTLGAPNSTGNLTVSGMIADGTGTLAVAKTSNSTVTLSGNNAYSGGTTVNQGTLTLAGSNTTTGTTTVNGGVLRFANSGAMNPATPNALVAQGGTVQMNGTSLAVGASTIGNSAILENASASPATITFASAGDSLVAGLIRDGAGGGALSLAKDGPGTLTLINTSHTYSGTTTINDGTLRLAAPSSTNPVASGLTWSLDASLASTINAGTPSSGDPVSLWTAAAGPSISQADPNRQPQFVDNAINGLSAIRFDGIDDNLFSSAANAQANTVFVVNNPDGSQVSLAGLVGGNGQGGTINDRGIRGTGTSWQSPGNNADFTNPAGSIMRINGVPTNNHGSNLHVLSATREGAPMALNAVGWYLLNFQRQYRGDIGEILTFDRVLTASEILEVEAYLGAKWLGVANTTDLLPTTTAVSISDGATLQLEGVNQTIGSLTGDVGAAVELLDSSSLTTGTDNTSTTFAGTISGDGSLTKTGNGRLTLSGNSSLSGPLTIAGGEVLLNGSFSGGPVVVDQNGRLSGGGTINGPLQVNGGTLAPGDASLLGLGTLTVNGDLSFASTWEVSFQGTDASLLLHNGDFLGDIDGVTLAPGQTFEPVNLVPYQIYQGSGQTGVSGLFDNFTPGGVSGFGDASGFGMLNDTLFAAYIGSTLDNGSLVPGNGIVLFAVPEPSRALLLTVALGSLLLRRRRP